MSRRLFSITVVALALAVGARGKGGDDGGGSASGGVTTGPGATADTITLGYLPDLSGVFAPNGKAMMEGANVYWETKNKAGGICGREVELTVQDTGYDPQKAVAAYQQMSGDVIGLGLVLGSPITSALLPSVEKQDMFLNFAGWTSDILPNENVAIAGTTYDIEAINAVDFLMKEKGVKAGDSIGHLYFEGDYGENALKGSTFAASKHDLKIVEQKITPADTDMTGQVAAFKRGGVKAILFSAAPPQAASLAGVAAAQKLDVPIVANGPGWTPQLLTTPAAKALEVGEVWIRGPNVMLGYWNRPDATAEALVDGWYRSGDIARADERGYLYMVDRAKDMIISGGENVYSIEVETVLADHAAVREAAVFGVPHERWGEAVHAVVVLNAGAEVDREALFEHCRERIAAFKVPRSLEIRQEPLPKSGAGNVLKSELRDPFWPGHDRRVG